MISIVAYLKMLIANEQELRDQIASLNERVTKLENHNTKLQEQISKIRAQHAGF